MEKSVVKRASELKAIGFDVYDALHLACAEQANVDVFLPMIDFCDYHVNIPASLR